MSGQEWLLRIYGRGDEILDPPITTRFHAASITSARRSAEVMAAAVGPYSLEPVCPLCDGLIEIGAPLHLEPGPDHAAEIYTHPACARRAARS